LAPTLPPEPPISPPEFAATDAVESGPVPLLKEAWICLEESGETTGEPHDLSLEAYGLTNMERERIREIDEKLGSKAIYPNDSAPATKERKGDFLDVAREERQRMERLASIDAALRVYHQVAPHPDFDDEASLLSSRSSQNGCSFTSPGEASWSHSSSTSLGALLSVAYRPISREDINLALEQAKTQLAQDPLAHSSKVQALLKKLQEQGLSSLPPTPQREADTKGAEKERIYLSTRSVKDMGVGPENIKCESMTPSQEQAASGIEDISACPSLDEGPDAEIHL